MQTLTCDLLVIGGGINGVGVAADAAGRGLSVVLCEKDDLANHTSSASSKLIHGGLRYLEQVEFKLVHEALREREILLHKAPYLVHPLAFVLPHDKHLRPAWEIRLGLFLYDYLARRESLKHSKKLHLRDVAEGKPLKEEFVLGFRYMDCQTDDARLVVINAQAAKAKGATILTRTVCQVAVRENGQWVAQLYDHIKKENYTVYAKAIINAAGAWVSEILQQVTHTSALSQVRLIKGSHIVVPKLYEGNFAYILQNADKRVVFAIPYQQEFTLIGTTDVPFTNDPNYVEISNEEIEYLCNTINYFFSNPIRAADIRWAYAGVRALYDNHADKAQKITREYHLEVDDVNGVAPIISIFGGKITTYRSLAEHVMRKLKPYFSTMGNPWTAAAVLPGGDISTKTFADFVADMISQYAWLPAKLVQRYAASYGTRLHQLLTGAQSLQDLGTHFGGGLFEKEVLYLVENEWALTAEDIVWRRSKLGLLLAAEEVKQLQEYLTQV
jgi:glycerol-3-phosphate dehydrogenase